MTCERGREPSSATKLRNLSWVAVWAAVLAVACAEPDKDKSPLITTSGPHAVAVGATITIVPSTVNGSDNSYTFTSLSPAIASVDPTGVVHGVAVGETAVTVTGVQTMASAAYPVVVVAPAAQLPDAGGDATPEGGIGDDGGAQEIDAPQVGTDEVPYYAAWLTSAHADKTAPAFNNWNAQGAVPTTCARCHSQEGFIDFLGGDGSVPGVVDKPAPTESEVRCTTCHAPVTKTLTSVTFPSGATVDGLGREAICMTCHQGRASGADVDKAIKAAAPADDDTPSTKLSFTNIHYYPAAATLFAGRAQGGYQYGGKLYDTRFRHVDNFNTCIGCHDPHSAKPRVDACSNCHLGVKQLTDLRDVRMMSSANNDYDGDGNVTEGIYYELTGLRDKLLAAIVRYGVEKHAPICYNADAYPYWFKDTNGDGVCTKDEAQSSNGFANWTPRLARAAYNFQMASKDPGAFAHNAKYIIELLYDSLENVDAALVVKVDMSRCVRGDQGHFDGASQAARHWDANDKVDATCSRCHSGATGFHFFAPSREAPAAK